MASSRWIEIDDAYLPVTFYAPDLTDKQWEEMCERYAAYRVEYTSEAEVIVSLLQYPETSIRNVELVAQLRNWARATARGYATESSGCFRLSSGARMAPDAAWISKERFRKRPTCPEFIIELVSPSDRLRKVREKMQEWIDNGAQLAWMLDPHTQTISIYRPGRPPEERTGMTSIEGEGPVAGFTLDLEPIWREYDQPL